MKKGVKNTFEEKNTSRSNIASNLKKRRKPVYKIVF